MFFQDARLFPHYKVRGNLRYGMAKSMAGQFDKLVSLLGIEPLLDRLPGGLSAVKSSVSPSVGLC